MSRGYWEACLVFLLSGWFLEPQVQGQPGEPMTTALTGSQVSLAGPNLPNMYKEITWFFSANLTILVQDSNGVMFFKNHLENRVSLGDNSTLHIHSLRKNDSSEYILRLLKRDGTVEERRVRLRVYDPVPTPVITVHNLQHRGPDCFLNLSCHVPSSETHINYSWLGPKGFLSSGHVLEVTTDTSVSYTCQARDSLSSSNSTVSFATCSEDPVLKPVITVQDLQHQGPGFLNLSCLVLSPEALVDYSWSGPKGFLSSSHVVEVVTQEKPVSNTCQARDPLDSSNSTVSFAACPTEHSSGRLDMAAWLLVLKPLVLQFLLS